LVDSSSLSNGSVYARYPGTRGNGIGVALIDASCTDFSATLPNGSKISDLFDDLPSTSVWGKTGFTNALLDEVHVVVYTTNTQVTGRHRNTINTKNITATD